MTTTSQTPTGKSVARLVAMLELKGHTVIRGDRNDFTVTKYGLTQLRRLRGAGGIRSESGGEP